MLLVFRQHRLALSATGGASATLPASSVSLFHCGAAVGGLFIGVYQVVAFSFVRVHLRESAFPLKMINLIYLYCRDMVSSTI